MDDPNDHPEVRPPEEYATSDEVIVAIRNLKPDEWAKLQMIARYFCKTRPGGEPENLLQEAVARTLDTQRRWWKGVTILRHLDRVMESISGHARATRMMQEGKLEKMAAMAVQMPPALEEQATFSEQVRRFRESIADDKPVLEYWRLRALEMTEPEIQQEMRLEDADFSTVRKRARRKAAKYAKSAGGI